MKMTSPRREPKHPQLVRLFGKTKKQKKTKIRNETHYFATMPGNSVTHDRISVLAQCKGLSHFFLFFFVLFIWSLLWSTHVRSMANKPSNATKATNNNKRKKMSKNKTKAKWKQQKKRQPKKSNNIKQINSIEMSRVMSHNDRASDPSRVLCKQQ